MESPPFITNPFGMQIYGIDLASEKFDVSFIGEDGKPRHIVVRNTVSQIEKFLDRLPGDARIVAEHTGVYGDRLLKLATLHGVAVSYVSGYAIRHSMGLVRGKSDPIDAARIREYGERNADRLPDTEPPSDSLYALRELYATRRMLVQQRKQLQTVLKSDTHRVVSCRKAQEVKNDMVSYLSARIEEIEMEMRDIIERDQELSLTSAIVQSVPGIGPVTAMELIIKTGNFRRVPTAKKCATLAGISPWPNATGKTDRGAHVSYMGDKELKSLLFLCARSSAGCLEKMRVYRMKKEQTEHKHYFLVMNNIANRLLKIIYALVKKREFYNPDFVPRDPRLKNRLTNFNNKEAS